ncbi:nucleotide exchange factor GrpE [Bdellovibrio sp. NC01]|uniref:nucleotide exchange factor GrpE n=1 Tax=Bdellovibrio sp. NC01 TaxID=2220073 RepID=UPI00115C1710|nr:nucleotide exchange factor GrpE [Bdellovibrio sp. NC01]QDK39535.1 nucleotide exchange factor GrpE [Bdellovibrio sp. NC01]
MSEENNSQNSNPGNADAAAGSSEIQKLQEQADKFKNDYLYLRAEFENYKRNAIKERSDLIKYGGERFVRELLEIVDNFDRALAVTVTPENLGTYKQGVEMTATELKNLLTRHNITEIPSEGVAFDPNIHEALSSEATDKVAAGHVARVFKKPYKMHDKVIRTGQVVVAKKPE